MTFYYKNYSWGTGPAALSQTSVEDAKKLWEHVTQKKNWRIVQLPNGFFQAEYLDLAEKWVDVTRRETIESAEAAIDGSIAHYQKKLDFVDGPKVVKTFE